MKIQKRTKLLVDFGNDIGRTYYVYALNYKYKQTHQRLLSIIYGILTQKLKIICCITYLIHMFYSTQMKALSKRCLKKIFN